MMRGPVPAGLETEGVRAADNRPERRAHPAAARPQDGGRGSKGGGRRMEEIVKTESLVGSVSQPVAASGRRHPGGQIPGSGGAEPNERGLTNSTVDDFYGCHVAAPRPGEGHRACG